MMHAGRILFALARYFQWFQQKRMLTEFDLDGLREDLIIVSRAGYTTVVEIKVSLSDWKADRNKNRWPSEHIARFFYAVPHDLYKRHGVPDSVPGFCGLLTVKAGCHGNYDYCSEEHAAKRLRAKPLDADQLRRIDEAFYYRFWRLQMDCERSLLMRGITGSEPPRCPLHKAILSPRIQRRRYGPHGKKAQPKWSK